MAVILAPKYHKDLLELLGKSLLQSAFVHAVVRSITLGIPTGFQIWVDKWPHSETVVVSADQNNCQNAYRRNLVFVHSFSNETLSSIIKIPGVVDFTRELLFYGLALDDLQTLERTFPERSFLDIESCHVFAVSVREQVTDMTLPDGFYIGEFTRDLVDLIVKNWDFVPPGVEDYLYDTFRWGFPTIVVYDNENEPVAWVGQHLAGMIGYLHVMEKYRRQGIASAILSMITKIIIQKDGFAFSAIVKDNVKSIKLHEKVGFKQVPTDVSFFTLVPPH